MKQIRMTIITLVAVVIALATIGCQTTGHVYTFDGVELLYVSKVGDTLIDSDLLIVEFLETRGFAVTPLDARMLTADAALGFDVVYISEVTSSSSGKSC